MSILRHCLFGIVLLDFLIRNGFCNQFEYIGGGDSNTRTFEDARDRCYSYNMTLPVLETREEYQDFWNFVNTTQYKKDLWLGLQWNQTSGFFEWLNGNILGIQYWAYDVPQPQTGQRCVYADGNQRWHTELCSNDKDVICFYKGEMYSIPPDPYSTPTDFFTAYRICTDTGGRLPVIITPSDNNRFSSTNSGGFWLGLIENNNQFVWVTGQYLGYYMWKDNERNGLVHSHSHAVEPYVTFHAPVDNTKNIDPRYYFCQNKTTRNDYVGLWGINYFRLVEKSIYPLASPRYQEIVGRGSHCAMACSRDVGCFKYTLNGTICRTYGNMDYAVSEGGVPLYERIRALQQLIL